MSTPGTRWLLQAAVDPVAAEKRWADDDLALLASGHMWDVVEAPMMPSIHAMRELTPGATLGPMLAEPDPGLVWWLVPLDAAAHLTRTPDVTVHSAGWLLACPSAHRWRAKGRGWIEPPDGSGLLTGAATLAKALARAMGTAGDLWAEEQRQPSGGEFDDGTCARCGRYTEHGVHRWIGRLSGPDHRMLVCADAAQCRRATEDADA